MKKYLGFIASAVLLAQVIGVGSAKAGDQWGAVAVGPGTSYGWAYNYATEGEAFDAALAGCNGNCSPADVVTFSNGCAAIATSSTHYGWSLGNSRDEAEDYANSNCNAVSGTTCSTAVWACTDR